MNKIILSTLALASLATLAPTTAHAGSSETRALVGGLIGGLIIGSAINNNRDHHVTVSHCPPPPPRCDSPRVVIVEPPRQRPPPAPSGYWKDVQTRVWVPGRWITVRQSCGREISRYENGYYTYRTDRVWVATCDNNRGDYGRGDNGHHRGDNNRYARR